MIDRPALAQGLIAYEAPDDSVILAGPSGEFRLSGKVYSLLLPLMDGARSADAIAELLSDRLDPAEVYYALMCLEAEACITEGGARHTHVEETFESVVPAHDRLLHPLSGIARGIKKLVLPNQTATHVYIGGTNQAYRNSQQGDVTRHLRSFVSGKGRTDSLARASLIGEAAERHSAVFRGDETIIRASYADLGDKAVHPNDVMLFSERQFAMREVLATEDDPIARALDNREAIGWSPVWSLSEKREKFAPTSLLYFDVPAAEGGLYCLADSNGNAAGLTRDAAMLQGLLELIERDAVGIWWFNAVQRPAIALGDLADPWVDEFLAQFSQDDREVWVLDLSTDVGIPVYAAISRKTGAMQEEILFGFGAHVSSRLAILRSLTELGQTHAIMHEIGTNRGPIRAGLRSWLESATIEKCEFLRPSGRALIAGDEDLPAAKESLEVCVARLGELGIECLVLDQTRPDVGMPVVKMLAPGLRHYRRRLAPGRLYSVPVDLGWLPKPRLEEELNPLVLSF